MIPTKLAVVLLIFGLFSTATRASDEDFIVLIDNLPSLDLQVDDEQRAQQQEIEENNAAILATARESALVAYRQVESDMKERGHSIADEKRLSFYDNAVSEARLDGPVSSIPFGYVPIDRSHSAFSKSKLKAINAAPEDDGFVHQAQYVFEDEDLGDLIVDELSFSTIPNRRIVVSRPFGNMSVNGHPASYVVFQNEDKTRSLTQVVFISDSKMFKVTALRAVSRSDSLEFSRLMEVAESLR